MYPESTGTPASVQFGGNYVVVNATGSQITQVSVTHTCGSNSDPITAASLNPGDTVTQSLNSQSGSSDHWQLQFVLNGKTVQRNDKRCDYEQNDAPEAVALMLYAADFSIIMPVTSSCEHNSYD